MVWLYLYLLFCLISVFCILFTDFLLGAKLSENIIYIR